MYYPYFRGKQFELIAIRESAHLLAQSKFMPIIEPVHGDLKGVERAINALLVVGGKMIVVVNPFYGDHRNDNAEIEKLLQGKYREHSQVYFGVLLNGDLDYDSASNLIGKYSGRNLVAIHYGFGKPKELADFIRSNNINVGNVFVDGYASVLYRRNFNFGERVLIRDGFRKMRNADYSECERFSDLHVTYAELGMSGFGDFLVVGDAFSDSGGPAYAVAIHVTFVDRDQDDEMFIYHFVSDSRDTPTDPAGKFYEALEKLIGLLDRGDSGILKTSAMKEFQKLYEEKRFPGLGYVKKLSMMHHLETMAEFCDR